LARAAEVTPVCDTAYQGMQQLINFLIDSTTTHLSADLQVTLYWKIASLNLAHYFCGKIKL